jgi:hypothetical protein
MKTLAITPAAFTKDFWRSTILTDASQATPASRKLPVASPMLVSAAP